MMSAGKDVENWVIFVAAGNVRWGGALQRILLLSQEFKCDVTTRPNNFTCRSFSRRKEKHIHSKLVYERSQTLFIIMLVWKQTKCPSANEEIRTIWYEMEYNSAKIGAGVNILMCSLECTRPWVPPPALGMEIRY